MSSRMRIVVLGLLAVALMATMGLGAGAQPSTIVNAIAVDPTYAVFIVAVDGGFYAAEGLDSRYILFESGSAATEVVVIGDAYITSGSELSGLGLRARGAPISLIATTLTTEEQMGAVARDGIQSPQDLIGKTVAMSRGNASEFYWAQYAAHYDLPLENITVRNVGPPEMVPALARGDVDAYFVWEPFITNGVDALPGTHILHRSGHDDVYTMTMTFIVRENLLEDQDTVQKMLRALVAATEFMNTNRSEAVRMVSQALNIPFDQTEEIMARLNYEVKLTQEVVDGQQVAAEWMKENGLIDEVPEMLGAYIRPEVIQETYPERTDL